MKKFPDHFLVRGSGFSTQVQSGPVRTRPHQKVRGDGLADGGSSPRSVHHDVWSVFAVVFSGFAGLLAKFGFHDQTSLTFGILHLLH